jgi:hypothetical protein
MNAPALPPAGPARLLGNALRLRAEQFARIAARRRLHSCASTRCSAWPPTGPRACAGRHDIVVGMPRSGLIVANVLADRLRLPLTTPICSCRTACSTAHGSLRLRCASSWSTTASPRRADARGAARLKERFPDSRVTTGALLPNEESVRKVDAHYRVIRHPRVFEWDLVHTHKVASIAFDLDGVLCEDVRGKRRATRRATAPGSAAAPFLLPRYEIDYIVTNRLERYRTVTEEWLARHGVRYRHLLMWDLPDKSQRNGRFAVNKIAQVLRLRPSCSSRAASGSPQDLGGHRVRPSAPTP